MNNKIMSSLLTIQYKNTPPNPYSYDITVKLALFCQSIQISSQLKAIDTACEKTHHSLE